MTISGGKNRVLRRMSQSAIQAESAEQFIMSGDFTAALSASHSAAALGDSTEDRMKAHVVSGKAFFCSNDHDAARSQYEQAKALNEAALSPREGLAEIEVAEGKFSQAILTYTKLLQLAVGSEEGRLVQPAKAREYLWRLAECHSRIGELPPAENRLRELLTMPLAGLEQRLEALCFLADVQIKVEDAIQQKQVHVKMEAEVARPRHLMRSHSTLSRAVDATRADEQDREGGLADTLNLIVALTSPSPRYLKYFEHHLQRQLSLLGAYPPRSQARQEKRLAALRTCKLMIETPAGGCCTPFPFEAAIWLWEETEELYGGHMPSVSRQPSLAAQGGSGLYGNFTVGAAAASQGVSLHDHNSLGGDTGSRSSSRGGSPTASPRGGGLMSTSPYACIGSASNLMSTDPRARLSASGNRGRRSLPGSPRRSKCSPRGSLSGHSPEVSPQSPLMQAQETSSRLGIPLSPPRARQGAFSSRRASLDSRLGSVHHTTDLSVAYTSRELSDIAANRHVREEIQAGRRSLDTWRASAEFQSSAFMNMMHGHAAESPFGKAPPPEMASAAGLPLSSAVPAAKDSESRALPPLVTSRRSSSFGNLGLPLDVTDSLRNVCANANIGNDLVTSKVEACGLTMTHMFPWAASSAVAVGLAMRRRLLSDPAAPSTKPKRQRILRYLQRGVARGADSAAGWMGLAELQYQERKYQDSYETGVAGLAWSVRRRHRGHETLSQFALSMRLVVAKALRRLQRLDEAEYAFKVLAGWVTEGDGAFSEMSGSLPRNIHQEALRGIAKVLLERGDRGKAKWQYEKILGKALLGRGRAEHWAHSEYAWIAFEDDDLQSAKHHLELAVAAAVELGSAVTEWELAEHHYRLGRVLWANGGLDRHQAKECFQRGATEEDHVQPAAFAWLGVWYGQQGSDPATARDMFQAALALDPEEPTAKEGLRLIMGNEMDRVCSLADWTVPSAAS